MKQQRFGDSIHDTRQIIQSRTRQELRQMIQTNNVRLNMETTPQSMGHRYRDWSNLPTDLLELISTKLFLSDFLSLKGVCSSWCCSLGRVANKQISVPFLGFLSKSQSSDSKIDANVFFLGINKGIPHPQKETPLCFKQRDIYCDDDKVVGYHPDGWLLLSDKRGFYFLIELLTHVRIDLPKGIMNQGSQEPSRHKAILSDNPNCRQDFIVIMLYGNEGNKKLAFWRNGDSKWRRLLHEIAEDYSDIVWCNDNLYALKTYEGLSVEVWDFNQNGLCSDFPKKKCSIHCCSLSIRKNHFVASLTGEVLVVAYFARQKKWKVSKVDLKEEKCVGLKTLNGQALIIVGIESKTSSNDSCPLIDNNMFCVSSIDVENYGYKANSIYLVKCESWSSGTFDRNIKLSNYSLEDNKVEELWETSIAFDVEVKMQPLGLFSINKTSCAQLCSRLAPLVIQRSRPVTRFFKRSLEF